MSSSWLLEAPATWLRADRENDAVRSSHPRFLEGWFWLPDRPSLRIPGRLAVISGEAPEVLLYQELFDIDDPSRRPSVLGELVEGQAVNLIDAYATHQFSGASENVVQRIAAEFLVLGDMPGVEALEYPRHSLEFEHLNDVAIAPIDAPRLTMNQGVIRSELIFDELMKPVSLTPFDEGTAHIYVSESQRLGIATTTWRWDAILVVDLAAPRTPAWVTANILRPISSLLSLAGGSSTRCTGWSVSPPSSGSWGRPIEYGVRSADVLFDAVPAHVAGGLPLFRLTDFGLSRLGRWLHRQQELGSLTRAILNVRDEPTRPVENRFLEAAISAEGLHRRLREGQRRLSQEEHSQLLAHQRGLDSPKLREEALMRLRHAADPTLRDRLASLAAIAEEVAPGITGNTRAWTGAVASARNGFAHRLAVQPDSVSEAAQLHALVDTLVAVTIVTLLVDVGVDRDALRSWLSASWAYRTLPTRWRATLPSVFVN